MPAPEPLDDLEPLPPEPVQPEPAAAKPAKKAAKTVAKDADVEEDVTPKRSGRIKVGVAKDDARDDDAVKSIVREKAAKNAKKPPAEDPPLDTMSGGDDDEDEDDALFDAPKPARAASSSRRVRSRREREAEEGHNDDVDAEDTVRARKRSKKAERAYDAPILDEDDDDEDEAAARPSSRRRSRNEEKSSRRAGVRLSDDAPARDERFNESEQDDDYDYDEEAETLEFDLKKGYGASRASVVDADFEDVGGFTHRDGDYDEDDDDDDDDDDDAYRKPGFGRSIRAERRRATALTRMEDTPRFDPDALDEEFFAALRVTPRELERAIVKARRRAEARDKNRMTPVRAFGWSAWIAAVAGTIYAAVAYRDEIVRIAPQTADAYAAVGIEASAYVLSIENVRHRLAMSTAGPTIEITGNLRNQTDQSVDAPLLQAEALGPRGELLSRWTFSPEAAKVLQGGSIDFISRVPAPDGVAEIALSFAPTSSPIADILNQSR
ncbi:MAG: hypothetical protein AAGC77_01035 [Pseudomonadota bacterium]